MVGLGCKPQNIQHMLDRDKNAKSSFYTPRIAEVLKCDPLWLAYGTGAAPSPYVVGSDNAEITAAIAITEESVNTPSQPHMAGVQESLSPQAKMLIDELIDADRDRNLSIAIADVLHRVLRVAITPRGANEPHSEHNVVAAGIEGQANERGPAGKR